MTIILIILLILLVIYLYYRNTNAPKPPETKPWKEDLDALQEQINELKNAKNDD
ncbi:hypothetical protein [endosymbiont GvMRE of Glomus versiforme]|uniref:hypothetical protein n=1 Tax=endosymbiont GvMRE of Glomus versiforme TaxID=2039283 RepID=UPI000EDBF0B0|nr:hypothetical protein [endosymbiont GvMRE of Glomus versiforme]RHZ36665.1 hypothetical protein GvMRE_I2g390 [endosymbiont GvMRE of Glomus versiforme]